MPREFCNLVRVLNPDKVTELFVSLALLILNHRHVVTTNH